MFGYHGCDESVGEELLSGGQFKKSTNDYDWLGSGIYFWEANPLRALEFAKEQKDVPRGTKTKIKKPFVVGAVIDLGLCLDLTTSAGIQQIRNAYNFYESTCQEAGYVLPVNSFEKYPLCRRLDCAVFNQLHKIRKDENNTPIDTVRGVFMEGEKAFEGAGFCEKTHTQICVCNQFNIKGVFRVPKSQLRT